MPIPNPFPGLEPGSNGGSYVPGASYILLPNAKCDDCEVRWVSRALDGCWLCGKPYNAFKMFEGGH